MHGTEAHNSAVGWHWNTHVLLFDENAEEISFPSIYLGQFRNFREDVKVTPFMMASSELRRSDCRAVTPYQCGNEINEVASSGFSHSSIQTLWQGY